MEVQTGPDYFYDDVTITRRDSSMKVTDSDVLFVNDRNTQNPSEGGGGESL